MKQGVIIMKKVGIIGGIGPASTLDYYNDIIDFFKLDSIVLFYDRMQYIA
jgi:aspartate/glutamate racemase